MDRKMSCQEFLARYSEYLDGEMAPSEAAAWARHMERCASCRRYDDVMRRGLALVRDLPRVEPSADFEARLFRRIWGFEMDGGSGGRVPGTGAAVALAVAAVLALIAWSPLMWQEPAPVLSPVAERGGGAELAPVVHSNVPSGVSLGAVAGAGASVADAGVPRQWRLYSSGPAPGPVARQVPGWWFGGPAQMTGQGPVGFEPADAALDAPGLYSPLVVGPPIFRPADLGGARVRAVTSTTLD